MRSSAWFASIEVLGEANFDLKPSTFAFWKNH